MLLFSGEELHHQIKNQWHDIFGGYRSGEYDVVILDELTIALHFGLLSTAVVLDVLRNRHPAVEVVITGRYAPQALLETADLVTEMRDVKHYYAQGIQSRDGIDR